MTFIAGRESDKWGLKGFIPFLIDLPQYARGGYNDLIQYMIDKAIENIVGDDRTKLKGALEKVVEQSEGNNAQKKLAFFIDGLDETGPEKRRVVENIEILRNRYEKAMFVVTSRNFGYFDSSLRGFTPYSIEALDINEISHIVAKWFDILEKENALLEPQRNWNEWALKQTHNLNQQLENNSGLKSISTNPLYLTFLVLLASDSDLKLPFKRADLFRLYFNKLLFQWEKKHGIPCPKEQLFSGFKEICWVIHRAIFGDIQNEPSEEMIRKAILGSVPIDPDEIITFWIRAGIFMRGKAANLNEFILPCHLSFLEYGFSCKLAEMWNDPNKREDVWKELKMNIYAEHLYEPLLVFIGLIDNPGDFLERSSKLENDLTQRKLILLSNLANEVKPKLENGKFLERIVKDLFALYWSNNCFIIPIKREILKCLSFFADMQVLKGGGSGPLE